MLLGLLFAVIALIYASVGFGGGSSYLALLVLFAIPYNIVPIIALICNIIVVTGNCFNYIRAGFLPAAKLFIPPIATSIPMAYLGGSMSISREVFLLILSLTLFAAGIRMLSNYKYCDDSSGQPVVKYQYKTPSVLLLAIIGAILGLISGMVGIGGGIFLAPILYNLHAADAKQITVTSSIFILLNSLSGLMGQLSKAEFYISNILEFWYLPLLVLIGGQVGNILTIKLLPQHTIRLLTAVLVLFVAARLLFAFW